VKQRGPDNADTAPPTDKTLERREFFRRVMRASYAAPAVATVFLASLQPGNPSGGMMTSSAPSDPDPPSNDPGADIPRDPTPPGDPSPM
jgi:hypothetical protein